MGKKFFAFLLVALLIGIVLGYFAARNQVEILNRSYIELKIKYQETLEALQQYFFFQDPGFDIDTSSQNRKWNYTIWNPNPQSYINITNGIAFFKYNESTGNTWGASILYQGKYFHSLGQFQQILGGVSEERAEPTAGVTFHKDHKVENYFLSVKAMLVNRTYVAPTIDDLGGISKGNIGIELMASFTQRTSAGQLIFPNYDSPNQFERSAIRIAIVISSFWWNATAEKFQDYEGFGLDGGDWYWDTSPYNNDYSLHLVRGKMPQAGVWYKFKIDLGEIISTVFSVLNSETNIAGLTSLPARIETITIHGVQVYVEGVGVSIEAKMNYVYPDLSET
ncbi:MAG: hypothetical protein ACE5R6_22085 [Candidatus Heimdallarchaeota archaeon]